MLERTVGLGSGPVGSVAGAAPVPLDVGRGWVRPGGCGARLEFAWTAP